MLRKDERETIRQRQADGIAAAKMRGVRFGKPRSTLPQNFPELYQRWRKKQLTIPEFAEICNIGRSRLYTKISEYEKQQSIQNT